MKDNIAIIGAGIIGLATACELQKKFPQSNITVFEKEAKLAAHQSSHNSGVIHSGVYYKPNSEKALNCRRGYNLMVDFCKEHSVPFDLCGKIIAATEDSEIEKLNSIYQRGLENGLTDLAILDEAEIKKLEPHCAAIKGIHVPQAGIVDYHKVSQKLSEILLQQGTQILFNHKVLGLSKNSVDTNQGEFNFDYLVTTPGLYSDRIAKLVDPSIDFKIIPFRGEYYELRPEAQNLVKNLIYPVPDPKLPFLGVHFTRMINGGVECGPNAVFALAREGYSWTNFNAYDTWDSISWPGFHQIVRKYWKTGVGEVNRSLSKAAFVKALQKLLPVIKSQDLSTGGAGVRAQACGRNGLIDDFWIEKRENATLVLNAPSPAATSSLAIAERIVTPI